MTDTIDPATFKALQETAGADFVGELVAAFVEEAPGMLKELSGAFAADEADRFKRAAHSLKSNGLTFGALGLAAMAKDLELTGLAGVKARGGDPVAALTAEVNRACDALKGLVRA
jgi:HPt (histidine-containing phosphotransfer) domain-containing protein